MFSRLSTSLWKFVESSDSLLEGSSCIVQYYTWWLPIQVLPPSLYLALFGYLQGKTSSVWHRQGRARLEPLRYLCCRRYWRTHSVCTAWCWHLPENSPSRSRSSLKLSAPVLASSVVSLLYPDHDDSATLEAFIFIIPIIWFQRWLSVEWTWWRSLWCWPKNPTSSSVLSRLPPECHLSPWV